MISLPAKSLDAPWRRGSGCLQQTAVEVERETGIGPATNSLEGCDSTTELLPPERGPAAAAGCGNELELMMGLEPMTSPLPRECSTTELHQRSCCERFDSNRARAFARSTRTAKSARISKGIHRTGTSRSGNDSKPLEYPCTCTTADASIVNHVRHARTSKRPSAKASRVVLAAGLARGSGMLCRCSHGRRAGCNPANGAETGLGCGRPKRRRAPHRLRCPSLQNMVHRGGFEPP